MHLNKICWATAVSLILWAGIVGMCPAKQVDFVFPAEITLNNVMIAEYAIDQMVEPGDTLRFWINSPGGSVTASIAMYDYLIKLRKDGVRVNTYGTGLLASGATIVLQAGETRYVTPFTLILVHGCQFEGTGNWFKDSWLKWKYRAHKKYVDNIMTDLYICRTHLPRKTIEQIMSRDTWMYAITFKELGFCDKLYIGL
jgi:ATP-dependent Clp protease protease subunit